MNKNTKAFFKQYKFLRIIYREVYHFWREAAVILFSSFYREVGFKTVDRTDILQSKEKYKLREFGNKETRQYQDFYTIAPIPQRIKDNVSIFELEVARPFVCEIDRVEIIGNYPVAFDRDRNLILETTLPRFTPVEIHIAKNVSIKTIIAANFSRKNSKPAIKTACILINPWSNNFWHWTIDTLTQLEGIEYYEQQTGIRPKLIVEANLRSWQRDSLKLLGYDENDWIAWQNFRRTVDKLIVPSFRRSYEEIHSEVSIAACQWLRQKILGNIHRIKSDFLSFSPNVFISRRKALGRRIANENEVVEALKPLGFVTHILEEMSYVEQVKLFAQAKVIVAPHGAGLTNLLFAENPIILELFGSYVGNEFANLARGLGFKYGCLGCQPPRGEIRQKDGDMVVDVAKLLDLLAMMK